MRPAGGGTVLIALAMREREDLLGGARDVRGGRGKFPLVEIIHGHRLAQHELILAARRPREGRIAQEALVTLQRREVVPVGVAVALGEHPLGVGGIEDPVGRRRAGFLPDVIVHRIERLAGIDALGVVPIQAIIRGRAGDRRREGIIAAAEQGEFLFDHVFHLALEGEPRGVHFGHRGGVVERDGGIGGIGVGLVAENRVEIAQITGRQQERVVHERFVVPRVDADVFAAIEDGFVNFDQAKIVDAGKIQGDVALPPGTGGREQAHVGVHRIVVEIRDPLIKRIDARQDAFDPAGHEARIHPIGPGVRVRAGDIGCPSLGLVAHGEIIVAQQNQRTPERRGGRATDDHLIEDRAIRSQPRCARRHDQIGLRRRVQAEIHRRSHADVAAPIQGQLDQIRALLEIVPADGKLLGQPSRNVDGGRDQTRLGGGRGERGGRIGREGGHTVHIKHKPGKFAQLSTEVNLRRHAGAEIKRRRCPHELAGAGRAAGEADGIDHPSRRQGSRGGRRP